MTIMKKEIVILCVIFVGGGITNGFKLISNNDRNNIINIDMGKSFTMDCQANDDYEYCTFEHNGNKVLLNLQPYVTS